MDKDVLKSNIGDAIGAHGSWKLKLATSIRTGKLPKPAADISCDNQCSFGKWMTKVSSDPDMKADLNYSKVRYAHAEFHRQAGRVAEKLEAGDPQGAQSLLEGPEYRDATQHLVALMSDWRANL